MMWIGGTCGEWVAAGGVAPVGLDQRRKQSSGGAVETGGRKKNILCLGSTATSPGGRFVPREFGRGAKLLAKNLLPAEFFRGRATGDSRQQVIFQSEDGIDDSRTAFRSEKREAAESGADFYGTEAPSRQMLLGFHYMDYYHNGVMRENQYLARPGDSWCFSVNYRLGVMYGPRFPQAHPTAFLARERGEYKGRVWRGRSTWRACRMWMRTASAYGAGFVRRDS